MAFGSKMNWGDLDEEDQLLPPTRTLGPDENGVYTIISYEMNGNTRMRKTKKVKKTQKQTRIPKRVGERRKNFVQKFGDCEGVGPGPEDGITSLSFDTVSMEFPGDKKVEKDDTAEMLLKWAQGRRKRYRDADEVLGDESGDTKIAGYIPPHLRGEAGATRQPMSMRESSNNYRDEGHTLRVTNISEDTKEADLQELFRPFGRISRIYLAKDRVTMQSRGFAFVTYLQKEDAESAKAKLDGYGYDHLILKLEWAQPSKPKDDHGGTTTFRSGYGKALPQDVPKKKK